METISAREQVAAAVLDVVQESPDSLYAEDVAQRLPDDDAQYILWTIWRLIDEHRLVLDADGQLLVMGDD